MSDQNGVKEQDEIIVKAADAVLLSDTTKKIMECARVLESITKDKSAARQDQYYARRALNEIKMLVASKVLG